MEAEKQIQNIHDKVQLMLKKQQQLQKENAKLTTELNASTRQLAILQKQNEALSQKIDAAKLGFQTLSAEDKKALNIRIDDYLAEIDKCLAMLNT
jgi:septal ring factor EnvC (AmiA/AmiB activator)